MSSQRFSSHELFPVCGILPLPEGKQNKNEPFPLKRVEALYPQMGIAFLWLKYKLNYTQARTLRVTVLWGYVEITITSILYHKI